MTLDAFITKYLGQTLGYPDGQYVGECLSLAKVYIKECFGFDPPPSGSNSAYGYWSNFPNPLGQYFTKVVNTPDGVPKRGDIVIWNTNAGNGYGHIAIFLEGTASSFKSLDQNWNGRETHVQGHYYSNVVGWLTPIMSEKTYTQAEWQLERDERNKNWELYQAALTKISELEKNISDRAKATEEKDRQDQDYFDSLVVTLAPEPDEVKGMTTREIVKYEVNKFIDRESKLQKQIKDLQKEKDEEVRSLNFTYQTKIRELEIKLGSAEETIDDLKVELDKLKELKPPTSQPPTEKPISRLFTSLYRVFQSVLSSIRKILWLK